MAHFQHWTQAATERKLFLGINGAIGYDEQTGVCVRLPRHMTGFEATVRFRVAIPGPEDIGTFIVIGKVRTKPENEVGAIKLATKRFTEIYNHYLSRFAPQQYNPGADQGYIIPSSSLSLLRWYWRSWAPGSLPPGCRG